MKKALYRKLLNCWHGKKEWKKYLQRATRYFLNRKAKDEAK